MPKYLIEGSSDGSLFSETISANSMEDAEAFAVERLCEAWGEEYGPDTTLDDLGDAASVTEYTPEDYERDAAPVLLKALVAAERFVRGFEDDETQEGINALLSEVRAAIAEAKGEEA